jgi:cell wall-associated NlpC family hydrolase
MQLTTKRITTVFALVLGALMIVAPSAFAHSVSDTSTARHHIEDRGRSVMGTRYTYGGSTPRSGFDCSGFTSWVFRDHGAELPHSSIEQFRMAGSNGSVRIWKIRRLVRGDLVFFKTTSARVGHAGIYLSKGRFIHSSSAGGEVQISSMTSGYYRERFVGATRPKVIRG